MLAQPGLLGATVLSSEACFSIAFVDVPWLVARSVGAEAWKFRARITASPRGSFCREVIQMSEAPVFERDSSGDSSVQKRRVRTLSMTLAVFVAGTTLLAGVSGAEARTAVARKSHRSSMRYVRSPYPGLGTSPSMEAAILATFPSTLHRQALNVAWCESRGRATARNGQYRGHFQMGSSEWKRFGAGDPFNAYDNSRAAYRYYVAAGSWRPWQCQP